MGYIVNHAIGDAVPTGDGPQVPSEIKKAQEAADRKMNTLRHLYRAEKWSSRNLTVFERLRIAQYALNRLMEGSNDDS